MYCKCRWMSSRSRQISVVSPSFFLVFIKNLFWRTRRSIYSFANDSTSDHSFSLIRSSSSTEVQNKPCLMNGALNRNSKKIEKWVKRIGWLLMPLKQSAKRKWATVALLWSCQCRKIVTHWCFGNENTKWY